MARVHVVSCGTSILGGLARDGSVGFNDGGTCKGLGIDELARRLDDDGAALAAAKALVLQKPEWFAELTAMRRYLDAREVDVAYLVGTKTGASRLAIGWLRASLEARGVRVEEGTAFVGYEESEGVGDVASKLTAFAANLQVLRARTLAYVLKKRASGDEVFIAAQGGYKPEAGVMMLVGAETGATVYYAHEQMRESVELPVLLYRPQSLAPLQALAAMGPGRHRGPRMTELVRKHPQLVGEAARAYAVEVRRDHTGGVEGIELTGYGRLLAGEQGT